MTQSSGFMGIVKLTGGPVNQGGTVALMSPGVDTNTSIDRAKGQVAANGYVYVPPQVTITFGSDFINITNNTGITWPQHSDVAYSAPYTSEDLTPRVAALETKTTDHETRIAANNTDIGVNKTDIVANKTDIADHETRLAVLETAAP